MNSLRTTLLFTFMTLVAIVPEALTESPEEDFGLEIPEECRNLGVCEDIPNYPEELANKVVSELKDSGILLDDTLSLTTAPDDTRRVEPVEENLALCSYDVKTIRPKAAVDAQGKWHIVVNPDDHPIHKFVMETCSENSTSCAAFVSFQPGYNGTCKQNFMYEYMTVLQPGGTNLRKLLRIPSNCSCVGQLQS